MDDTAVHSETCVASIGPDTVSQPFVGRWQRLVSTTNWEKGRIISEWRAALIAGGARPGDYSDEIWSLSVGGVSAPHVGRLRRVHQRFGSVFTQYDGLFWSHFHTAIEWEDAEMWLEGAVQNAWSVARMRRQRLETLGAITDAEPRDEEAPAGDLDEDFQPDMPDSPGPIIAENYAEVPGDVPAELESADDDTSPEVAQAVQTPLEAEDRSPVACIRPFENLAALPHDLAEAFELFKLAILRHKTEGWQQIRRDDLLRSLDALKELAVAPSENRL